jgi:hypothetical protein
MLKTHTHTEKQNLHIPTFFSSLSNHSSSDHVVQASDSVVELDNHDEKNIEMPHALPEKFFCSQLVAEV